MSIGRRSSTRAIRLSGVLVASLLATPAFCGVAQATITAHSTITTPPSSPVVALETGEDPTLQVSGTADGSAVDISCYTNDDSQRLAQSVVVTAGHFSTTVHLASNFPLSACELRAVDPSDLSSNHGPGNVADPEQGVYLRLSRIREFAFFPGGPLEYEVDADGPAGLLQLESAGGCALYGSAVYDSQGNPSERLFDCDGGLFERNFEASRSSIRIDGADAYDAAAVSSIETPSAPLPGQPQLTVTSSVDPATGAASVVESEPIVKCSPGGSFPPNAATDCTSFASTGVTLETRWATSHEGELAVQESRWTSTDGKSHSLDAIYEFGAAPGTLGSFRFPGDAGFAERAQGDTAALPAGPATYYFKRLHTLPDGGDGVTPLAGFTYASAPDGPLRFLVGNESVSGEAQWEMPYQRTIPAEGALDLSFAYSQGLALGVVETLAHGAEAALPLPEKPSASQQQGTKSPGPSSPRPATPRLVVASGPKVGAGRVTVKLRCVGTEGSCQARVKLVTGHKTYASATRGIAAGGTAALTLKLNAAGRRALKSSARHRLSLTLTVAQTGPDAPRNLLDKKLTLKEGASRGSRHRLPSR